MKPVLLLVESSAEFPSVALGSAESIQVLWEKVHPITQSHSEQLPLLVEEAISVCRAHEWRIVGLAVNEGPGSYTGLRIGSSLVKALAYAWNLPMLGVSGLHALALAGAEQLGDKWAEGAVVWSLMDARRSEVYALTLKYPAKVGSIQPYVLDETPLPDWGGDCYCVGNGAFKLNDPEHTLDLALTAATLQPLALAKYSEADFADVAYFEPFYLKDFQPGINKKYRV